MANFLNKIWDSVLNFLENNKIYKESQGAMIAGVAKGLSERFGVSVQLIRVLFVIATIVSFGTTILIYVLLALVMPVRKHNVNYRNSSYIDGNAQEKK